MREKLLKSLRYTLEDAENWLEVAKNENDENWIDHMGQYLYNLGRAYQTACHLRWLRAQQTDASDSAVSSNHDPP